MPDHAKPVPAGYFTICALVAALFTAPLPAFAAGQPDARALEQLMQQAGGMPAMDGAQMEAFAAQAAAMQQCMANIDQSALTAMQQEANSFRERVKALCAGGQRDEAMAEAMRFGREISQSDVMREMTACGEHMAAMMPGLAGLAAAGQEAGGGAHVCDAP